MVLKSYSKINLSLSINSKTRSGLHEIQSYFCLINLFDQIKVNKIEGQKDIVRFQGEFKRITKACTRSNDMYAWQSIVKIRQ